MTHSFYVITKPFTGEYHTLSFYGTKIAIHSKGAWAMDTDSDMSSYSIYTTKGKNWKIMEIETGNGIDTAATVKNIIGKIDSCVTFYYRDHVKKKPGMNNCNTALWETLVENEQ